MTATLHQQRQQADPMKGQNKDNGDLDAGAGLVFLLQETCGINGLWLFILSGAGAPLWLVEFSLFLFCCLNYLLHLISQKHPPECGGLVRAEQAGGVRTTSFGAAFLCAPAQASNSEGLWVQAGKRIASAHAFT